MKESKINANWTKNAEQKGFKDNQLDKKCWSSVNNWIEWNNEPCKTYGGLASINKELLGTALDWKTEIKTVKMRSTFWYLTF